MTDRSLPSPDPDGYQPAGLTRGGDRRVPTAAHPLPSTGHAGSWEDLDGGKEGPANWREYVGAILRNKWIVALGIGLGLGAGFLAERTVVPQYTVSSTLWIETGGGGAAGDAAPIRPSQLLSASGWVDLMRSFTVLDPVVQSLQLYARSPDPRFDELVGDLTLDETVQGGRYELRVSGDGREMVLRNAEGEELERVAVGGTLGESVGFRWTPTPDALQAGLELPFSISRPRDEARRLAQDLDVRIDREGTFLSVSLTGSDPERITRTVNELVERYAEVAERLKRAQLDELTGILEEQLAYAEDNLRQAELQLENFRVQTVSLPSQQATPVAPGLQETQNPVFQNFFNLKLEQEELRRDQIAIQRALEGSGEGERFRTEALEVIPSVRESSDLMSALRLATEKRADLRTLRLRYTDEHPSVQELREDLRELEGTTIPGLVRMLLDEVEARQRQIDQFLGQATQELQQIPARAVEETRLERRFDGAESLFLDLQTRFEAARLGAASTIPDVRVLDQPRVPQHPSSDPSGRFFAMAALLGLGLGIMGAIVRDRMDPALRRPEQVTQELGLPILATIPHARRRNGRLREKDEAQVIEAFRNLRLAVSYAHGAGQALVTTVTSPGVGDGKSFTTSNLGLAFAEMGHSTLIVDGDIRRGTMHTLFDRPRKPGLTDYLSGDATKAEVIRETDHPSLRVVPSGARFRDAPELLGLPAMAEFVEELREDYDVVLIDTAPLGAAVDPYILGTLSGSLLIVLRNGATDRELAGVRLGEMQRLPIQVLGAVLNDVPTGSGPYQYYSYLPGYEARDEEESERVRKPKSLTGARS